MGTTQLKLVFRPPSMHCIEAAIATNVVRSVVRASVYMYVCLCVG